MLSAIGLSKSYQSRPVLRSVSFTTTGGRPLVVRGSNGSGKTTLLRCLLGSERADSGEVLLEGRARRTASHEYWRHVYGVLDDFSWFPDLTIGDHLALHDPGADTRGALEAFEIAGLADRTAVSLSSGQLRRAALATTLVRPWRVLLLDEPEQRLDDDGLRRLAAVIDRFGAEGRTVVLSTHSDHLQSMLDADLLVLDAA